MWTKGLVFITSVVLIAGDNQKLMPFTWKGGLTKMNSSRHHYNGLATRAQIHEDDAFVCIPRIKEGIEATLLKIHIKQGDDEDLFLQPFPDSKSQIEGNCKCLQSVVDLFLDPMEILWVLDSGRTSEHKQCSPKVVGYNLQTGKTEKEINLSSLTTEKSEYQFLVSDYNQDGDCFIYIADPGTQSILVYDIANDRGHKINIPSNEIQAPKDNIMYLELTRLTTGENLVYFTYRASNELMCINAHYLQNGNLTSKPETVGRKPRKMVLLGTDDWECIYFRYENSSQVYKWNSLTEFETNNFVLVHKSREGLTPTQALTDYKRGVMRVMESNVNKYMNKTTSNSDAINSLTVMAIP